MRTSVRLGLSLAALVPLLGLVRAPARLAALEAKADAEKEQRAKLEEQARAMNAQMIRLYQAGKLAEAADAARQALAMREKLYPASRFKDGHPELASSLNNLGSVLRALGRAGRRRCPTPRRRWPCGRSPSTLPVAQLKDRHPGTGHQL